MTVTEDNMYSEENIPTSNWMKFDKVGDGVKGVFKEQFNKEGDGVMPDQVVFVLAKASIQDLEIKDKKPTGKVISEEAHDEVNVGVKITNSYVLTRLKNVKPGDKIAFAFTEEIAPKQKGYNPAKSIQPYKGGVDQEWLDANKPAESEGDISVEDIPF